MIRSTLAQKALIRSITLDFERSLAIVRKLRVFLPCICRHAGCCMSLPTPRHVGGGYVIQEFLDEVFPETELEVVASEGTSGPGFVREFSRELSRERKISPNLLSIGSPRSHSLDGLAKRGEVRRFI